jgi:hypothetical protein
MSHVARGGRGWPDIQVTWQCRAKELLDAPSSLRRCVCGVRHVSACAL